MQPLDVTPFDILQKDGEGRELQDATAEAEALILDGRVKASHWFPAYEFLQDPTHNLYGDYGVKFQVPRRGLHLRLANPLGTPEKVFVIEHVPGTGKARSALEATTVASVLPRLETTTSLSPQAQAPTRSDHRADDLSVPVQGLETTSALLSKFHRNAWLWLLLGALSWGLLTGIAISNRIWLTPAAAVLGCLCFVGLGLTMRSLGRGSMFFGRE